ncbi:putative WRKY transcription factor 57 [Acorus gramineus]|uniref:WRKY transcription factor 57 n=1 Tax=Acorus gramineus TaxID=55184 RepID=A0AAV9BCZ9_ACOGR|nr:putative WRKY transcription factor 57 [Acorus gramineus]
MRVKSENEGIKANPATKGGILDKERDRSPRRRIPVAEIWSKGSEEQPISKQSKSGSLKNQSNHRSYYRCTNTKCMVKKRVERSSEDPMVVITTYEGQHCHHSVSFSPKFGFTARDEAAFMAHLSSSSPPPLMVAPASTTQPSGRPGSAGEGLLGDVVTSTMWYG